MLVICFCCCQTGWLARLKTQVQGSGQDNAQLLDKPNRDVYRTTGVIKMRQIVIPLGV